MAAPRKLRIQFAEAFLPLFDPYRHKAYYSGRGGAKSTHFAEALGIKSMSETLRIVCARQFQNSIAESSKELIEQRIKKNGLEKAFRIMEREIIHKSTDSRFTFIGLERNIESIKSLEGADIAWVEEARAVKQKSIDILIPTIRKPGSEIWWSWNPKYRTDPVDFYFRGEFTPPNSLIREVTLADNPWFYTTEMPAEEQLMKRANKDKHAHIWGGAYDEVGEARIFTNTRIGRVPIPDNCYPLFGMDFGFANDPNALIKIYVIEELKQIYIAQEAFGRVPLNDLHDLMSTVTESRNYEIVCDSSRPETIDFLKNSEYNWHTVAARKGPGSIKAGIEWLQGYDIVIDPDCIKMQEEATSYCWKVDEHTDVILPVPVDADNHGWDSVRYATEVVRDGSLGRAQVIRGKS